MAFRFKKQIFGFMDLLRFKKLVPWREKKLAEAPATPLPDTYRVNETAKILHPGTQDAVLKKIVDETADMKTYTFALSKRMIFRAGQYVTVGHKIGSSYVSRPYAISSSPLTALNGGELSVTVKKVGFFSGWLYDNARVGDVFKIGDPSGFFCYDGIRDRAEVLGIAGGSGITPFVCMARAIAEGSENFSLTLLYGAKTVKDLAFKDELDALSGGKFKVIYVLSDEKKRGYENGFITAEIIKKYAPEKFTAMLCGPQAMYSYADGQLAELGVVGKYVRKEANCVSDRDVQSVDYKLRVRVRDEVFDIVANSCETLLTAMERAGINAPSKCRAGGCGYCHSRLIAGKYSIAGADKRRLADAKFGFIHPCCTYPDSDMEIEVPAEG